MHAPSPFIPLHFPSEQKTILTHRAEHAADAPQHGARDGIPAVDGAAHRPHDGTPSRFTDEIAQKSLAYNGGNTHRHACWDGRIHLEFTPGVHTWSPHLRSPLTSDLSLTPLASLPNPSHRMPSHLRSHQGLTPAFASAAFSDDSSGLSLPALPAPPFPSPGSPPHRHPHLRNHQGCR